MANRQSLLVTLSHSWWKHKVTLIWLLLDWYLLLEPYSMAIFRTLIIENVIFLLKLCVRGMILYFTSFFFWTKEIFTVSTTILAHAYTIVILRETKRQKSSQNSLKYLCTGQPPLIKTRHWTTQNQTQKCSLLLHICKYLRPGCTTSFPPFLPALVMLTMSKKKYPGIIFRLLEKAL